MASKEERDAAFFAKMKADKAAKEEAEQAAEAAKIAEMEPEEREAYLKEKVRGRRGRGACVGTGASGRLLLPARWHVLRRVPSNGTSAGSLSKARRKSF